MESGWWNDYSLKCQPVDHSTSGKAMRVSFWPFKSFYFSIFNKLNFHLIVSSNLLKIRQYVWWHEKSHFPIIQRLSPSPSLRFWWWKVKLIQCNLRKLTTCVGKNIFFFHMLISFFNNLHLLLLLNNWKITVNIKYEMYEYGCDSGLRKDDKKYITTDQLTVC